MRSWLLAGVVACGACSNARPAQHSDAAADATPDVAVDAPVDAAYGYSIAIDMPSFPANAFDQHVVTVTGYPSQTVVLGTDRLVAGNLRDSELTLDSTGTAHTTYVPCSFLSAGCIGTANLTLALKIFPHAIRATTPITLTTPPDPEEVAPCMGSGANVLYLHGDDYVLNGTSTSAPTAVWTAQSMPDELKFSIDGVQAWFSLRGLVMPIQPGTYTSVQREPGSPGHAGLDIHGSCSNVAGTFKIYDYAGDPVLGTPTRALISFEQVCDNGPGMLVGCLRYSGTAPTVPTPPVPDPTKVAVTVHDANGLPDTTAIAIFTDSTGVVLDTQVDAFGFAQAKLTGAGELTVIQHPAAYTETGTTYRGVRAGDQVVVGATKPNVGNEDFMLASFTLPTNATGLTMITSCGGGSWTSGTTTTFTDAILPFFDACRKPTFDMLSIAQLPSGNQYAWQTGVSHVASGNLTVSGPWHAFGTIAITLANVPAGIQQLSTGLGMLVGSADGAGMDTQTVTSPAAGDTHLSMAYAVGAGDGASLSVLINPQASLYGGENRTAVVMGSPSAITVDFAAEPVPAPSAPQQTDIGASWTKAGTATADVRNVAWRAIANNQHVVWTLVEPDDGSTSTLLPRLPAGHAADDPANDPMPELHGCAVDYENYDVVTGFTPHAPSGSYQLHWIGISTVNFSQPF